MTSKKLGKTSTKIIFSVYIYSPFPLYYGRLPQTSFLLNISNKISLFKKRDDKSIVGSKSGLYDGDKRLS